ncbi:hypothetical protein FRC04_011352 [Tulasnella sp. 424]|nr:hypothetical protein FRC04_011352 [Tulasnella sp. 424]
MVLHTATSAIRTRSGCSSPSYHLPVEVFALILKLCFPDVDHVRRETRDMQEIYSLRLVSKSWKELIEDTATLWTHVSTRYPTAVIRDCLRRSNNYPLRIEIRHVQVPIHFRNALISRLQLLQSHSYRWRSVTYNYFRDPRLILTNADGQCRRRTGQALKHVKVHGLLLPWSSSLLRGLETLSLEVPGTVPVDEIINLFDKNPALKSFELYSEGTPDSQSDQTASWPANPAFDITAHSLENVTVRTRNPHFARQIMSRVSMPNCESLNLSTGFATLDDTHTLYNTLAQFVPKIKRALSLGGRTRLIWDPEAELTYEWCGYLEYDAFQFDLEFSGVEPDIIIEWIRNFAAVSGSQVELEVCLVASDMETAQRLGGCNEITKLDIECQSGFTWDDADEITPLMDLLGDARVDPFDNLSWAFPNLKELSLRFPAYELMKVFNMLSRRYLHDTYVQVMEASGISIHTPPKLDLWVEKPTEPADAKIMTALKNHWGVKNLNQMKQEF